MGIEPNSPEASSRRSVSRVLRKLPYSGSLLPKFPDLDLEQDAAEFNDTLEQWLLAFASLLKIVGETQHNTQVELDQLRGERAAVRSFFNTDQRNP